MKKAQNGVFVIYESDVKQLRNKPCFYCGSKERLTLDHIVPISRGGVHSIGNLVTACKSCNSKKGDRFIMEWRLGKTSPRYKRS